MGVASWCTLQANASFLQQPRKRNPCSFPNTANRERIMAVPGTSPIGILVPFLFLSPFSQLVSSLAQVELGALWTQSLHFSKSEDSGLSPPPFRLSIYSSAPPHICFYLLMGNMVTCNTPASNAHPIPNGIRGERKRDCGVSGLLKPFGRHTDTTLHLQSSL